MKKIVLFMMFISILLVSCKAKDRENIHISETGNGNETIIGTVLPGKPDSEHVLNQQTGGTDNQQSDEGDEQMNNQNEPENDGRNVGNFDTPEDDGRSVGNFDTPEDDGHNLGQRPEETTINNDSREYIGPEIPGVTAQMQDAAFWINRYEPSDEIILTTNEIRDYNEDNFKKLPFLNDLISQPETMSGNQIRQWINQLSTVPKSTRFNQEGKEYRQADYELMEQNLNLDSIPTEPTIRYGLTVRRTLMRTWPSEKGSFSQPQNRKIDYNVETAVYPAEPVSIYHTSKDGKWFFAGIYHYKAWIPVEDIALCTKDELLSFQAHQNYMLISGAKLYTPESEDERISKLQLDMGVSLPKANRSSGYEVLYPVKNDTGGLEFLSLKLPESSDMSSGYLPYTTANVLKQAFKFIGETYGWGGMNNARDCTAFLVDIYRSFGIRLPRNSDQQQQSKTTISLQGKDRTERLQIIEGLKPGSALYMPGHAMMYLGEYHGTHFIIHDITTIYEKGKDGSLKAIPLNQVSVTPLEVYNSKGNEYLMLLTTIVEFQ